MFTTMEDLLQRVSQNFSDPTSDISLELMTDIKTATENTTIDWKEKFENNDREWREKYRSAFFSSPDTTIDEDEEEEEKDEILSYDSLFTVKENKK